MKLKSMLAFSLVTSMSAFAAPKGIKGSDTLAGLVSDAIIQGGLENELTYLGTGSGNGEKAAVAGEQGIAPMSREMKKEAKEALKAKGINVVEHVLGLDGIAIFAKQDADLPLSIDVPTITKIFKCELTKWEEIPGSKKTGAIQVFRRNDASGTTDAFKQFTGIKEFGACAKALEETVDLGKETSVNKQAIAFAGLSGKTPANAILALASKAGAASYTPTIANIRNGNYPFARKLFVYELEGKMTDAEANLIGKMTDRFFMDPILVSHGFFTLD